MSIVAREMTVLSEPAPATEAIERLAERVHFLLEKYDPTGDPDWDALTDHQKEIFRATIRGVLESRDLLMAALGLDGDLEPTTA